MGIDDIVISKTVFDGVLRNYLQDKKKKEKAFLKAQNENHAASVYVTDDTIYVVWFAGSNMGNGDIAIYLSTMNPLENAFTKPRIISKIDGYSCQNPVICCIGEKLIVYHTAQPATKPSLPYSQEDALLFRIESMDKGLTWSYPTLCWLQKGFFIRSKPCIVQGRVLLPAYTTPWDMLEHRSCLFELDEEGDINDNVPQMFLEEGLVQPCLVKVENEYHVYFRDRKSESIYVAFSKDGITWTSAKKTVLPNNNSGIAFEYLGKNCIAAILNPTNEARYPLSLFLSRDKGKTWNFCMNSHDDLVSGDYKKYIFDGGDNNSSFVPKYLGSGDHEVLHGPEMSYPATHLHKGKLHVVYSYCRGGICYIQLDLEELI